MNIGVVLLCRYESRRLPGKILKEIRGRTVLSYIAERIRRGAGDRQLVVATSEHPSDDPIASYCARAGLECHRGPLDDVAARFLGCAESRGWDYAVRVNGDNLFLDSETLLAMLAIAETGVYDLVTNVPGRRFPYGMSVEIVRTEFYRQAMQATSEPSHREHVTSWLYEHPTLGTRYVFPNRVCPEAAGLPLALDTTEDLVRAERILERAGPRLSPPGLRDVFALTRERAVSFSWRGDVGPMLIAEIGGNHEGNFEVAREMAGAALSSGADCIKFQLYRGDTLVSPVESPDRHKHFQRFELTRDQHLELARMCREGGAVYNASVWDLEMLDWIDPFLTFYKVGSGDLTAWPILRELAKRRKPILLSTGLATMDEVLQTVGFLQRVDEVYRQPEMLCIMQCTSMYPIPDQDANLRVMDALRAATGVSVGYSNHTVGAAALRAAAAMGAEVLEFHFTTSREGQTFRDHKVSLLTEEVRRLKEEVSQISALRGSGVKVPQASELAAHHEVSFRRGAYVRRMIRAGEVIKADDVVLLRPAHGTDARDADSLVGAVALNDLEPFRAIPREATCSAAADANASLNGGVPE